MITARLSWLSRACECVTYERSCITWCLGLSLNALRIPFPNIIILEGQEIIFIEKQYWEACHLSLVLALQIWRAHSFLKYIDLEHATAFLQRHQRKPTALWFSPTPGPCRSTGRRSRGTCTPISQDSGTLTAWTLTNPYLMHRGWQRSPCPNTPVWESVQKKLLLLLSSVLVFPCVWL